MIFLPSGTRIWLVAGITDMRNGFNGLAAKVQTTLKDDPISGHVFIFRGRSGSQVKLLWSTGDGLCLLTKRLELLYSLLGTCKLNGIDPERYLHHVLDVIADWPVNRVSELLPWRIVLPTE
ncbi:hypothetical protein DP804_23195 [Salmonella enterica subsp. enterica]|nr:hypothetical protein [Salmonella enterica subsp. enterica serovar Virchow]